MCCHFSEVPKNPAKSSLTATTTPGRDMAALLLGGLLGPTALASATHMQEPLRSQEKTRLSYFPLQTWLGRASDCSSKSVHLTRYPQQQPAAFALKQLLRWLCCRGSRIHRAPWQGGCSEQTAWMGPGSSQPAWMAGNSPNPEPRSWLTAAGGMGQSASWDPPPPSNSPHSSTGSTWGPAAALRALGLPALASSCRCLGCTSASRVLRLLSSGCSPTLCPPRNPYRGQRK